MAKYLVISDYPAFGDPDKKLLDNHGRYFWHLLLTHKAPRDDLAIEFVYASERDMKIGASQIHHILNKHKPKVVLALGQTVAKALGEDGKLAKIRGSVFEKKKKWGPMYIIPTYHPRELKHPLRVFAEEPIEKGIFTAGDIARASTAYHYGWKTPKEQFNLAPTLEEVRDFVDYCITNQPLIGCDLEATGLNIEHVEIIMVGLAISESEAMVIPLLDKDYAEYWPPGEKEQVIKELNRLFKNCKFAFQNGFGYDVPLLRQRGYDFPLENYTDETMVLHHAISPEMPHNLGMISSQYGKQPEWKDDIVGDKGHMISMDQERVRLYNARDSVALLQILKGMWDHVDVLIDSDPEVYQTLPTVYRDGMRQAQRIVRITERGITKDPKKLKEWHDYAKPALDEAYNEMLELGELPETFSFTKDQDVRWLLYHEKPSKLDSDWETELKKYESTGRNYQYACPVCDRKKSKKWYDFEEIPEKHLTNCPKCDTMVEMVRTEKEPTIPKQKSKDTDTYRELCYLKMLSEIKPLYKLKGYEPLETASGQSALDKAAIVRYLTAITLRVDTIKKIKRKRASHKEELEGLEKTLKFLIAYQKWSKMEKLVTSFWDFKTWGDGRVRTSLMPTGTATGRLSSKKPNLQQIPSGEVGTLIRSVFRAKPGYELMSVDFEGLEVFVAAYFMEEKILQDLLEKGTNFHDHNMNVFFGMEDKEDPMWGPLRRVAKMVAFARLFYAGSDRGIYAKAMAANPDSGLTFQRFKQAVENWLDVHKDFSRVSKELEDLAVEKRVSITAGGRVRQLMGPLNAIKRQAVNTPIQGSAAEAVRDDMIEIDRRLEEELEDAGIVLQVHDELIAEYKRKDRAKVAKIMKEVMTREREIKGQKFHLRIDAEIGTHWGAMKSIDLDTLEVRDGSKH